MDPEVNLDGGTGSMAGLFADNYPVPMSAVLGLDITF